MAALTFRLLGDPPERLDLAPLTPDRLAGLPPAAIAALPIGTTRRGLAVGDVFRVTGDDADDIRFDGGSERFDRVGAGMSRGRIHVAGPVGLEVGRGMSGGAVDVAGSAGPRAGAAMAGGRLDIGGDAGDFAGGALHGAMAGMSGGILVVVGTTGARTGDRMRRGLIVALGGLGAQAGARMAGGTLVAPSCGAAAGMLMKRGSIVAGRLGADGPGPTFVDAGDYRLPFLALLARHIAATVPAAATLVPTSARRWRGDMASLGKGEILTAG